MDGFDQHQRDVFFEIHSDLPRQSAGSIASTLRALEPVRQHLPTDAVIADIGCGPGSSIIPLGDALPSAKFYAVDLHQPFLEELLQKAMLSGVKDRISVHQGDMNALPFEEESLDMIWCEGAIYNIGVEHGLRTWRKFLKPGGYLVFNEPIWLQEQSKLPKEVIEFWTAYPAMTERDEIAQIITDTGYALHEEFNVPEDDWWDEYYGPLSEKLTGLEAKYNDDELALIPIASTRTEIEIRRKYAHCYNYRFFMCGLTG